MFDTVDDRLRWAMICAGIEPTPYGLAHACAMPPARAHALFGHADPPELVADFARTSRRCKVRMVWLATGESVPQISEVLTRDERKLLQIADNMDTATLKTFIAIGESLVTVK